MALKVGDRAPDATVFPRPKEPRRLLEYNQRPLVLLFFPLAFSGVCTKELCTVAEDYSAYQNLGAEVIGISIDSPYVNVKFAEACGAQFPIVSDFNKEATRAYDVMRSDLSGLHEVSERAAFVMRHYQGCSIEEIGRSLGLKTNATKHSIFRAVRKMRIALEPFVES